MTSRLERRGAARVPTPMSIVDDDAEDATLALARAVELLATSITTATTTFAPAAEFFGAASDRLDKLCHFLKTKGPWLLGSAPAVLVAIGAITPSAASKVSAVVNAVTTALGG